MSTISQVNSEYVRKFVKQQAGISLSEEKEYLLTSRLTPLSKSSNSPSLDDYINAVRTDPSMKHCEYHIIDALTTNETLFFRDHHPWQALKKLVIPDLINKAQHRRKLTFWCAASSTGQEPYSLAMMLLKDFPQLKDWNIEIHATDISEEMIQRAQRGIYSQFEVNRGLPAPYLIRYFQKVDNNWQLNDMVKSMVRFKKLNLLDSYTGIPQCDLVAIRNVLIYFEEDTRINILSKIKELLRKDGYIFLGSCETCLGVFKEINRPENGLANIYQP